MVPLKRAPRAALVSGNAGKLRELRRLLPFWEIGALDTRGIGEETGATFEANALAKAAWGRSRAEGADWVIGEDSGLECEALGGAPGVRSARFAGIVASDEENIEKLLADLAGAPPAGRTARYRCAIVALDAAGCELVGHGCLRGSIAEQPRGTAGFGYDPVFIPIGERATVAELGEAWKDGCSHRAKAARALLDGLRSRGGGGTVAGRRRCASVPAMDPAQALADLTEISAQIEAAVILDSSGTVLASSMAEPARSESLAQAARQLFTAAEETMGGPDGREKLVQLQAALPDGCVFVVRDDDRVVAAVTTPDPTVGLVFYDLKTCLRHVAGEELAPTPKARAGSKQAAEKAATEKESGDGKG